MRAAGRTVRHGSFFDTVTIEAADDRDALGAAALEAGINLRPLDGAIAASFDETTTDEALESLLAASGAGSASEAPSAIPSSLSRKGGFMRQPVFHRYRTETEMLRYMRSLADRDLALDRCMIPLGSCTMKLNATAAMLPVTWPEFARIHPYAPHDQAKGYAEMLPRLEELLADCTGDAAVSLPPTARQLGRRHGDVAAHHRCKF